MSEAATTKPTYRDIPIADLHESTWNPRKHYDQAKLQELADSILEKGVVEPILVRPNASGFEIVAGSRRFRASKLADLATVPALIRELDDVAALELAVIENGQREDVNEMDEALGYQALKSLGHQYTVAVIAAKVGKAESYVYRRLKLLELEEWLRDALAEGRLSAAHAERLLRLTPKLRAAAAHPENGVVWRRNPLLEYDEKWVPEHADLRPINELEHFIRTKSTFDPRSEDARHFQPGLAEQLDEVQAAAQQHAAATNDDQEDAAADAVASLISLSDDPLARTRLNAKQGDAIPLTPSKWKEVDHQKKPCAFMRRGVITHGGPTRILWVCTKRSCQTHWPVDKKAAAKKKQAAAPTPKGESWEAKWEREEAERRKAAQAWATLLASAGPAFAQSLASIKFSAALVRDVLDTHALRRVFETFGVTLTEKTAAQVLVLSTVRTYSRDMFLGDIKGRFKFNLGAIEQRLKADAAKAEKAKAAPVAATSAKKPAPKKKGGK